MLVCGGGASWLGLGPGRGAGVRLGLAGLVVVLVGLDQGVKDPGEFADVAGGQGLDEVTSDPFGVRGPGLLEPLLSGRGERDVEPAAVGGADRPGDEPVAFHAVQQPGDAAAAERGGDDPRSKGSWLTPFRLGGVNHPNM